MHAWAVWAGWPVCRRMGLVQMVMAVSQTRCGWMLLLSLSASAGCGSILGWWGAGVHRALIVYEGLCVRGWTLALQKVA